jgi:hypothetical protein
LVLAEHLHPQLEDLSMQPLRLRVFAPAPQDITQALEGLESLRILGAERIAAQLACLPQDARGLGALPLRRQQLPEPEQRGRELDVVRAKLPRS